MELWTIAVISPGEMGSAVARGLRQAGRRVVSALDGRSSRTRQLAEAAGVEDLGSLAAAVREADVLLSILPPVRALELARQLATERGSNAPLLYVDCNAVSPLTVRQIAAVVGFRFVDVGIIGFPNAPRFYASGPAARELVQLPLDIRVIGEEVGQASGLKMCYASLTKGLTALMTEALVAADALEMSEHLHAELADSQPELWSMAQRALVSMVPKAYRWVGEMEEIAATFASVGLSPRMAEGAADVYRLVDEATRAGNFEEVVAELRKRLASVSPAG